MIKVIVVAWFTFILAVMSIAPISLTVKWIKGIIKEDTNFSLKKIFFIIPVVCFSVVFCFAKMVQQL